MPTNWNTSTAIVGFYDDKQPFTEQYIRAALSHTTGFKGVVRPLRLTRAAVVKVHPDLLDQFMAEVSQIDIVEYVEHNSLLRPAAFHSLLPTSFFAAQFNNDRVRHLHKISEDHVAGRGVRVAMIDTGLSPHPLLPRASFTEVVQLEYAVQGLNRKNQAALSAHSATEVNKYTNQGLGSGYIASSQRLIRELTSEILDEWNDEIRKWLNAVQSQGLGISLHTAAPSGGSPHRFASQPLMRAISTELLGVLRRVSLDSFNFVNDSIDIEDTDGHGTQMAGIISGRSVAQLFTNAQQRSERLKFEPDVLGLAPEAELLVLKVFDAQKPEESNVNSLIRAFEYLDKVGASVAYLGLVINPATLNAQKRGTLVKRSIALDRTVSAVAKSVPIVCPAGNGGGVGLFVPSQNPDVFAITNILDTPAGFALAKTSSWAELTDGEVVAYCAYGGDDDNGVMTTSREFGMTRAVGTSVSAAIATGIIARALSSRYQQTRQSHYSRFLNQSQYNGLGALSSATLHVVPASIAEIVQAATTTMVPIQPAEHFGRGLLCEFRM
jgi:subtilisin family serine protease